MEFYRKMLAKEGVWDTANGPFPITRARMKAWAAKFNAMRGMGLAPPIPWGHKLSAVPRIMPGMDDATRQQAAEALEEAYARWNTGYIERAEYDPARGALYMHAQVPPGFRLNESNGCLENPSTGTRIREVSPGFADWTDGYGNTHEDVLIHAALCTHPVQAGMTGFERSPIRVANSAATLSGVRRITNYFFLGGKPMAEENTPTELEDEIPPVEPDEDDMNLPPPMEEPLPPIEPVPLPETQTIGGTLTQPQLDQFKQVFAGLGIPLLPDTTLANGIERMLVLLHGAMQAGATLQPKADGAGAEIDLGLNDAVADQNGMAGAYGSAPTFMSSLTGKVHRLDASGLALAKNAAVAEARSIEAEWDQIAKGANAQIRALAMEERGKVGRFHLSMNPESGRVDIPAARRRLNEFKKIVTAAGVFKFVAQLSKGVPDALPTDHVDNPMPGGVTQKKNELAAEVARLVSQQAGVEVKPESITILNRRK